MRSTRVAVVCVLISFVLTSASDHQSGDHFELGDAGNVTNTEQSHHHHVLLFNKEGELYSAPEGEHVHEYIAICFMMVAMVAGNTIQIALEKAGNPIPYTCACFFFGIILSLIHDYSHHGLGTLSDSIEMWLKIDPHLLLYTFLPALIFADAINLNVHLAQRVFFQCLLLAGPGVLMGSVMNAAVAKYIFPYGWDWNLSMAFGAILSATDPVAVVALLKSLGASKQLTMAVTGESLMNDGAAIVVFILFWDLYQGEEYTVASGVEFFAQLALGGPVVGILFGIVTIWMISCAPNNESGIMIQISTTVCSAYLTFFVAEHTCKVSGVLAVCGSALVGAAYGHPLFHSGETMEHVWGFIELVGNTLIFMLAGLMIGDLFYSRGELIEWQDYCWLLECYVFMTLARAVMLFLFFPLLQKLGPPVTWQEATFMVWGGLRGAVGLALAIVVDRSLYEMAAHELDQGNQDKAVQHIKNGTRMMFMVGGIAALTLIVNAPSSGFVLKLLGMMDEDKDLKKELQANLKARLIQHAQQQYQEHSQKKRFENHDDQAVFNLCKTLNGNEKMATPENCEEYKPLQKNMCHKLREVFLGVVRRSYMQQVDENMLPGDSNAIVYLLGSVDIAEETCQDKLDDFTPIKAAIKKRPSLASRIVRFNHHSISTIEETFYMLHSYIEAHTHAQEEVCAFFGEITEEGESDVNSEAERIVMAESSAMMAEAERMLELFQKEHDSTLKTVRACQMVSTVLMKQRIYLEHQIEHGLLLHKDAHELLTSIEEDQQRLNEYRLEHLVTAPAMHSLGAGTVSQMREKVKRMSSMTSDTSNRGAQASPTSGSGLLPQPL